MWQVKFAWIWNKRKLYSFVSLTNFFQMLYPRLELLLLLNSNIALILIATVLLKLFCSNLLHPLPTSLFRIDLIYVFVFRFTLILQCIYFLLVERSCFSHEKVVAMQFDANRCFYAPIFAKWLPLRRIRHLRPLKWNKNRSGTGERKMYT